LCDSISAHLDDTTDSVEIMHVLRSFFWSTELVDMAIVR
jgi:hypothetical protein